MVVYCNPVSFAHPNLLSLSLQDILTFVKLLGADRRKFTILDSISGRLPPRRICLLLGPPGSGKSTLLKAMAGKLTDPDLKVSTLISPPFAVSHGPAVGFASLLSLLPSLPAPRL